MQGVRNAGHFKSGPNRFEESRAGWRPHHPFPIHRYWKWMVWTANRHGISSKRFGPDLKWTISSKPMGACIGRYRAELDYGSVYGIESASLQEGIGKYGKCGHREQFVTGIYP